MRTILRRALGGLLGIGIVTTAAAPARASNDLETFVAVVVAAVVIPDVVFATYGIAVAGKGELPSKGWSIAETIFTVPQTVIGNTFYGTLQAKDEDEDGVRVALLASTMGVTILTTHGIWSTATTKVRPGVLAGSSIAVGADVALSTGVIASALSGRFSGRPIGITTMLFTAPQIAAAGYLGATSPSSSRAGWIGLTAWSGTLFLHGLVSTIRGHADNDPSPADPPVPPPLPLPPKQTPPPPPPFVPNDKAPLMVPESLRIGPTIVSDGVATAMGIGVSGVLF